MLFLSHYPCITNHLVVGKKSLLKQKSQQYFWSADITMKQCKNLRSSRCVYSSASLLCFASPSKCHFPLCVLKSYTGPTAVIILKSNGVSSVFARTEHLALTFGWVGVLMIHYVHSTSVTNCLLKNASDCKIRNNPGIGTSI